MSESGASSEQNLPYTRTAVCRWYFRAHAAHWYKSMPPVELVARWPIFGPSRYSDQAAKPSGGLEAQEERKDRKGIKEPSRREAEDGIVAFTW